MSLPASYPGGFRAAPPASAKHFAFALFLAVCLHAAIIFGLSFQQPKEAAQATKIDVILAPPAEHPQAREAPTQPSNQGVREIQPAPAATPPPLVAPAAQLRKTPPPLGATAAQLRKTPPPPTAPANELAPAKEAAAVNKPSLDYADLEQRIAALGLELADQEAAEGLRPRVRHLPSASALNAMEANYLKMWRQRVERIGTANYPGGNLQGDLRVLVAIRHDGALLDARVLESSGVDKLDTAAMRIVRLAAPYAPFPVDMRKSYAQLEIIRTWRFSSLGTRLE